MNRLKYVFERVVRPVPLLLAAGLACALACSGGAPEEEKPFTREQILEIITEESPVLYRDGTTRLGVFFDKEHRHYVRFEQIPEACVQAIVASEDDDFYRHHGVDWRGILRATWVNLKARRVVEGGSTLTQQTAKNLFYRADRSFQSKLSELLMARQLERSFTKQEILEFYLNQFHVSGNGRGIGIAARYFFDRRVEDLTVQECAFMAGMVKSPARYNPWTGRTEAARQEARDRARSRTDYVLRRMNEEGYLDGATWISLRGKEIPFKKGTFQYERSVVLDAVESALEQPPLSDLLTEAGLDKAGFDGLRIITTLDPAAQAAATYGLWHHLGEVGPVLEGLGVGAFRLPDSEAPVGSADLAPVAGQFFGARVLRVQSGKKPEMVLDLGGRECAVDAAGLSRAASIVLRAARKNHTLDAGNKEVGELLSALPAGSVVRASVRKADPKGLTCDLEMRPTLQGAVVVLDRGEVLAMVGGNDNQGFNRATQSVRQFGSTWKLLVYVAALRAGWLPSDVLDNRRNAFPFEGSWYYPRPDHEPAPRVSLAWAGTRSENLASIWLLSHLLDRLDDAQFAALAAQVDLVPRSGESNLDWIGRVRDKWGVIATEDRWPEAEFEAVKREVGLRLVEAGRLEEGLEVLSLLHGRGVPTERGRLEKDPKGPERETRLKILDHNFLKMEALEKECAAEAVALESGALARAATRLWIRPGDRDVLCSAVRPSADHAPADTLLWQGDPEHAPSLEDPLVEGRIHASILRQMQAEVDRRVGALQGREPWDPELVLRHPDFRRLVTLRYVALLARKLGIQADLPHVFSLPLGAADVSLMDMANLYQAFLKGEVYQFGGRWYEPGAVLGFVSSKPVPPLPGGYLLIKEIRNADGSLLFRAEAMPQKVGAAPVERMAVDILRNVVRWGTGRRARELVPAGAGFWPLMGKTGTTNDYKNVAFIGYSPVAEQGSLAPDRALTVAAYVGYDDNTPMKRGTLRLAGASGALPAWMETVRRMAEGGLLGKAPTDAGALDRTPEAGMERVPVDEVAGLPGAGAWDPELPSILVPADRARITCLLGSGEASVRPPTPEPTPVEIQLEGEPGSAPAPSDPAAPQVQDTGEAPPTPEGEADVGDEGRTPDPQEGEPRERKGRKRKGGKTPGP